MASIAQWLERRIVTSEVAGSIPVTRPINYGECSSVVRASECGSEGRGFDPRHSPHIYFSTEYLVS